MLIQCLNVPDSQPGFAGNLPDFINTLPGFPSFNISFQKHKREYVGREIGRGSQAINVSALISSINSNRFVYVVKLLVLIAWHTPSERNLTGSKEETQVYRNMAAAEII